MAKRVALMAKIELSELPEILGILREAHHDLKALKDSGQQGPEWLDLKSACQAKGVPYGSVVSRPALQPNRGTPDGIVSGRRRWRRSTIESWLVQTDQDLKPGPARNRSEPGIFAKGGSPVDTKKPPR